MKCHWCDHAPTVFAEGESLGILGRPFAPRSRMVFCDECKNLPKTTELVDGKQWDAMTLGPIELPR